MEEYNREPCPWRIVDDCGGAFTMGLIGGGIFQSIKGFRNAPSGLTKRFQVSFKSILIDNFLTIVLTYLLLGIHRVKA